MNVDKNELFSFLKGLGIEDISKNEKKVIYDKINSSNSLEQVKRELELLFALNKVLISSYKKVSIGNMMKINEELDSQVIIKLFLVYNEIKSKSKDEVSSLKEFKEVTLNILNLNSQTNNSIEKDVEDSVSKLVQLKNSLYLTMSDKEKVDKLLDNCIRRSKNFISQSEVTNLEYLINYLKKNYNLSDDELVNISKRCATFFSFSSALKIENIARTINEFREFIEKKLIINDKSIDVNKILNKDFKDILINTPSIAVNNPNSISKTIRFLMGDKLGNLVNTDFKFFDVRGDFTSLQLAKIYNESITSLSISVEKIEDVIKNISESYENHFGSKLNLNNLINGHNFSSIDQLSKEDYLSDGKINDVFKLLDMFISKEDMENLLKNNFSFLIAPISDVKKSLKNAVLNSQNENELRKNVLQKIRNHFDMYESYHAKGEVDTSKIKIESLNKVGVKNIDEKELIDILDSLNASDDDIEKWRKVWNKEEKEIRDLEVELELEDILSELEGVKEFLNISYISAEQFIGETLISKNLFIELLNRYQNLVNDKKISNKLSGLSDKVNETIMQVANKIDNNIIVVIENYNSQLKNLNENLENLNCRVGVYDKLVERLNEIYTSINDGKVSLEKIEENEKKIAEAYECIRMAKIKFAEAEKNEQLADKKANKFLELLETNKKKIIKGMHNEVVSDILENSSDIFLQFARSLYEENLLFYMEEFDDMEEKDIMSYEDFRMKKLDIEQRKMTDEIYEIFKSNTEIREQIFCELMEYIDYYNIDAENVNYVKEAIEVLKKKLRDLSKENQQAKKIFVERDDIEKRCSKLNIDEIKKEISKIEANIEKFAKIVKDLNDKKICR